MARSLRVEYPGAYYHVMARGNRREDIFLDEDDGGGFSRRRYRKPVPRRGRGAGVSRPIESGGGGGELPEYYGSLVDYIHLPRSGLGSSAGS